MSTQLKVRLISAAPSCVAVDFMAIATGNISERKQNQQPVSCDNLRKEGVGLPLGAVVAMLQSSSSLVVVASSSISSPPPDRGRRRPRRRGREADSRVSPNRARPLVLDFFRHHRTENDDDHDDEDEQLISAPSPIVLSSSKKIKTRCFSF